MIGAEDSVPVADTSSPIVAPGARNAVGAAAVESPMEKSASSLPVAVILPFAINSTAVFMFRQFFLQLPEDLFAAARLDGANELRILWSVALPLVRPALLTAGLITFIGPWNEFLWPFLVTKDADMQPLAVSLANYISNIAGRADNPYGAILAGAVVLAAPAVALFIAFQKHFTSSDVGSVRSLKSRRSFPRRPSSGGR